MDLQWYEGVATSLFLHQLRAGAFFAVVPLFGRQRDSFWLRLILAVAMGSVFWWVGDQHVELPGNLLALSVMGIREGVIGIALGFALYTMTAMLISAGEIISSEMGFSMARTMNPESGVDATVVSQLFQVIGFLLILQLDLHHEALRVLGDTFDACPVGQPFALEPIWLGLRTLMTGCLVLALQYSFPVLGTMLLLTVALVLLGRAVPAINLMEFGFALRVLLALLASAWFLTAGAPFLAAAFGSLLEGARGMFVP